MIKLTKKLDFFVTKSFRRDKTQAPAYDKFRVGYWKNIYRIILKVVKPPHIERTNHE